MLIILIIINVYYRNKLVTQFILSYVKVRKLHRVFVFNTGFIEIPPYACPLTIFPTHPPFSPPSLHPPLPGCMTDHNPQAIMSNLHVQIINDTIIYHFNVIEHPSPLCLHPASLYIYVPHSPPSPSSYPHVYCHNFPAFGLFSSTILRLFFCTVR